MLLLLLKLYVVQGLFVKYELKSRMVLHLQTRYGRATLKPGNRNPESGIGNRNPESGIRNPESGIRNPESGIRNPESGIRNPESRIHKSKKTSSSNTQKLFSIAFACRK